MLKKIITYMAVYALLFMSTMLLFTVVGYYFFVFTWAGSTIKQAVNALILVVSFSASVAVYYVAEKLKLRI
ncbi:MAG TPA: hypothetical protein DCX28_13405 [Enterobacteriaceae bacterium]|nr:hypothetical protein [Enterobacteriaceae bacterium]